MDIIAHRGNKRYTPENTLAAFYSAATYPIDGIEFDIQWTKDFVPVVFHDEKIDRTTNGSGLVKSFTYAELRQFDAGSWFDEQFRGEKIPSFEEVLNWASNNTLTLHVEIKIQKSGYDRLLQPFINLIKMNNMEHRIVISSFDHAVLKKVKEQLPSIRTAFLTKFPILRAVKYAKNIVADAIHIRHSYQASKFYRRWTKYDLPVRVYNVHRLRDAMKCSQLKVDAIITNDPRQMTEVFRKED
ncbi:glycerophosphodiester phosphodiesterase [Bacillus shivajii]|uniref:glycerophosphodiester phosphodiesterase n=1 Tax=Bacillus shivajii TaxID=1983719 RepID=UPI001CF97A05|nr:glycerophosphodiester phosphodiesterase family protein [Bacillus shivajii]UCZ54516.1 glycerophosphodiester phosphodiesterase [Bacillus shivajii]